MMRGAVATLLALGLGAGAAVGALGGPPTWKLPPERPSTPIASTPTPSSPRTPIPGTHAPSPRRATIPFAPRTSPQRGASAPRRADSSFARLVARLSEPGGFFDSDNLVSNEASYLHVMGAMRRLRVEGGAYIGVGPDQNFSYIAQIRPHVAYLIDIRRDNLLQHLLYKALFGMARSRGEFLALLFGKPLPAPLRTNPRAFDGRPLASIISALDSLEARRPLFEATRDRVARAVRGYGIPIDARDLEKIAANEEAFFTAGFEIRFTSLGRPARSYYPSYRQLILETDLTGRPTSFLATEDAFRYVQSLQARDLIVPVVGDLSGTHAMAAIARDIADRHERVSAFYVSNVEFYLMRGTGFEQYARNVAALPRDSRSVIIRSYFGGFGQSHPQNVPGYFSTQILQPMNAFAASFAAGELSTYWDVVTRGSVDLR